MLLTLTSVLVVILWHIHADPLSAEERQLVGTWRRFNADGTYLREEHYRADRSLEKRFNDGLFFQDERRWSINNGRISLSRHVPVSKYILSWTAGCYFSIGNWHFAPFESYRRSGCKNALKHIGLGLMNYYEVRLIRANVVFGETIHVVSNEFPAETHTLRRLVSESHIDQQQQIAANE